MSNIIGKITNILLIVLIAISAILAIMFYIDISGAGEYDGVTQFTGVLIDWTIALFIIAAAAAVVFSLMNIVLKFMDNAMAATKSIIPFVIVGLIFMVAYFMASDVPLHMPNYEGSDNVPGTLKWSDAGLIMTWILLGLAIVSILYAEVSKLLK